MFFFVKYLIRVWKRRKANAGSNRQPPRGVS
jgi:hypothetical protein